MNAPNPIEAVPDENPEKPDETVVTARFSRKKLAKYAGTAAAVLGLLTLFGANMKKRGKDEFVDDLQAITLDEPDEADAS